MLNDHGPWLCFILYTLRKRLRAPPGLGNGNAAQWQRNLVRPLKLILPQKQYKCCYQEVSVYLGGY